MEILGAQIEDQVKQMKKAGYKKAPGEQGPPELVVVGLNHPPAVVSWLK